MLAMEGSADTGLHQPEGPQPPQWIPLRDMFTPGSIGQRYMQAVPQLGERLRPETTLDQPLAFLWKRGDLGLQELQNNGYTTAIDVLAIPDSEFRQQIMKILPNLPNIQARLRNYLSSLAVTPHGHFFESYFHGSKAAFWQQHPVPPDREGEIMQGVEEFIIHGLGDPEVEQYIFYRHGLRDGIVRSHEQVRALMPNVTPEKFETMRERAEGQTPVPQEWEQRLAGYATTPETSFARTIFDVVFLKDKPVLPDLTVGNLVLSQATRKKFEEVSNVTSATTLESLFQRRNYPYSKFPDQEAIKELKGAIQRALKSE